MNVYAGTTVRTSVTFKDPAGVITDPTDVTLKFRVGKGSTTTWTYGGTGSIVKDEDGQYHADLDTTATSGGWDAQWEGTAACAAVDIDQFEVIAPPL